ncbi:MAG: ZIP family metal transporter [Actinomycetota bacterium]
MELIEAAWIVGSGAATAIGGISLLFFTKPSELLLDALLGFTSGVMLAASSFSLLVPAVELGGTAEVVAGIAAGGALFAALDAAIPHAHARFSEHGHPASRRAALLLSALTIHNVPEGMAVGVSFAAGGLELGIPIALAIGIQNIPEGFAAGAPLLTVPGKRRKAAALAAATGAVEPPAAFAAFTAVRVLLPFALAFAAGAMLYVVADELIPESHAKGNERFATLSLIVGFMLMLTLDNLFS